MPRSLPPEARAAVLAWYDARGRALAFRTTRDPYGVLVSEVMAQQTQISRVVEAWGRFLDRFPTVAVLADASPAEVLRAWQGMGYDRRALNLWRAAQAVRDDHAGTVPRDIEALQRLPGVGPYTARAVAAIAFGAPIGAVDTNIRRVLTRAVAGESVAGFGAKALQETADASVDPGRPGDWTHALMDIGATLCRPRRAACDECPIRPWCRWAAAAPADGTFPAPPPGPRTRPTDLVPFQQTTRWLRGRIVDRLRAADGSSWTNVGGPIGSHDDAAISAALDALARDGIVELHPGQPRQARLATA
jgi:A/G-specific adenine glycosylase